MRVWFLGAVLMPGVLASQSRPNLYQCEGCEAIYERSFEGLSWSTVIPPASEPGERMVLTGRVYQPDGKTPASDVVIYVHHTDAKGVYPVRGDERGWARRHGYLRAWVKTNASGDYRFETIRPAPASACATTCWVRISSTSQPSPKRGWP